MSRSRVVRAGVGLLALILVLLVVQVLRVHHDTGEFRLTPSAAPPKLHELGREYQRSSSDPSSTLPRDTQRIGETSGGGELFEPRHLSFSSPVFKQTISLTVLYVRDDDGDVWTYGLVGGP